MILTDINSHCQVWIIVKEFLSSAYSTPFWAKPYVYKIFKVMNL